MPSDIRTTTLALLLMACGTDRRTGCPNGDGYDSYHCREMFEMSKPCRDESRLLATTTGSPSAFACPNRLHRMRVEVSRAVAGEEIGALVFCECKRETEAADAK
jgi:hypothetical protein